MSGTCPARTRARARHRRMANPHNQNIPCPNIIDENKSRALSRRSYLLPEKESKRGSGFRNGALCPRTMAGGLPNPFALTAVVVLYVRLLCLCHSTEMIGSAEVPVTLTGRPSERQDPPPMLLRWPLDHQPKGLPKVKGIAGVFSVSDALSIGSSFQIRLSIRSPLPSSRLPGSSSTQYFSGVHVSSSSSPSVSQVLW